MLNIMNTDLYMSEIKPDAYVELLAKTHYMFMAVIMEHQVV